MRESENSSTFIWWFGHCHLIFVGSNRNNPIKMSAFQPNEFNAEFDHQASVREMFAAIGFTDLSIKTVLTNGCSHYVTLSAEVIDKSKMYTSVFMYEDFPVTITVRVSDHRSGLDAVGVDGDKMTFAAFNKLVESGAIAKHA